MTESKEEKPPKQQSSDANTKPVEREIQPKEAALKSTELSEGFASRAGEEGISLQPMGSNNTNPFTPPQASLSPAQTEKPSSGSSVPNASLPPTPEANKDTSDK